MQEVTFILSLHIIVDILKMASAPGPADDKPPTYMEATGAPAGAVSPGPAGGPSGGYGTNYGPPPAGAYKPDQYQHYQGKQCC